MPPRPSRSAACRSRVATDGVAPNSGDAVKTFVDANIQITPPTATNRVGTNAHVHRPRQRQRRHGGFVNAPDGTQISFTIDSGPGALRRPATPAPRPAATGSCTVDISSADDRRHDRRSAHTTRAVGGVSLTRRHERRRAATAARRRRPGSNAKIAIAPDATNEVGQPHTFTVTLLEGHRRRRGFVAGRRRARRRHADGLERRRRTRRRPGTCTTPARTRTPAASARSPSPRPRRAR